MPRRIKYKPYEVPIPPDSPEWKNLPKGLEYIKAETWKLGIGPQTSTTFTRRYVLSLKVSDFVEIQQLYDSLEQTGDGVRLYRWANGKSDGDRNARYTVLCLFVVMNTLELMGKLRLKKKKRIHAKMNARFPNYLLAASEEFYDWVFRGMGLNRLSMSDWKILNQLAKRVYKDYPRINKYLHNRSNSSEDRHRVLLLITFLTNSGVLEEKEGESLGE